MTNIPHLLLAAGISKRMGEPKQLLNWGNKKLIQFQIERILSTTEKLYVVLGAYADLIEPYLKDYNIEIIRYDHWKNGMGGSLAYGIQQILKPKIKLEGILISLIDQPLVPSKHYLKMRSLFIKGKDQIVVSESDSGWCGVPILFDAFFFDSLKSISGEEGAKVILKKNQKNALFVNGGTTLVDMDTPDIYQKLAKKFFQS